MMVWIYGARVELNFHCFVNFAVPQLVVQQMWSVCCLGGLDTGLWVRIILVWRHYGYGSLSLSHSCTAHTYLQDQPSLLHAGFHVGCVLVLPLNWTALWNHSDSRCESRCDCCDCLWINDGFVMNWQAIQGVSYSVHYGTHSSVLFGISTLRSVWIHPQWQDEFIHRPNSPPIKLSGLKCLIVASCLIKTLWWRQWSHVKRSCARCLLWFWEIKGHLLAERWRETPLKIKHGQNFLWSTGKY